MSDFVIENGVLTRYTGPGGDVVIPEGVTEIASFAFSSCPLKEVIFPEGLQAIRDNAFYNCGNIQFVSIPDTVEYINHTSFGGTISSTDSDFVIAGKSILVGYSGTDSEVTIPDGVRKVAKNAFNMCSGIKKIVCPDSLEIIEEAAFAYCSDLEEVEIPVTVKHIGQNAFRHTKMSYREGCLVVGDGVMVSFCDPRGKAASTIDIPEGVKTILSGVIRLDKHLKHIKFPASLIKQEDNAFVYEQEIFTHKPEPYALETITVAAGNPVYHAAGNCLIETKKKLLLLGAGKSVIPDDGSVTEIAEGAFYSRKQLKEIVIPSEITQIPAQTFAYCVNLQSIVLPENLVSCAADAFEKCEKVQHLVNRSSVPMLYADDGDVIRLKDIPLLQTGYLPREDITRMDSKHKFGAAMCYVTAEEPYDEAQKENYETYLKRQNSKILDALLKARDHGKIVAFLSRGYVKPDTLAKAIEASANDPEMVALLLNYQNKHMDMAKEQEKKQRKAERALLSDGPTMEELKKLWKVRKLDDGTLMVHGYKGNEADILIPEKIGKSTVSTLGPKCGTKTTKSVTIPNTVTTIADEAFQDCKKLRQIDIPDSVVTIGGMAFYNSGLKTVTLPRSVQRIEYSAFEYTPWYDAQKGMTIVGDGCLLKCTDMGKDVTVPDGVKSICSHAFTSSDAKRVILPDSVRRIEGNAFVECRKLTSVHIPDTVEYIGPAAFAFCNQLTQIHIPSGLERIMNQTFFRCSRVTEVVIPAGVTAIDFGAFRECRKLASVTIPEGVTVIDQSAFPHCKALTCVELPFTVTEIGDYAFYGCDSLTDITIPNGEAQIKGDMTFLNCPNLTIHAPAGSYAEEYAKKNNIPFEAL